MNERLLIFTRFPSAGEVKTRLIADLGADRATALHEAMTRWTITWAEQLAATHSVAVEIHGVGASADDFQDRFGFQTPFHHQASGDLGALMLKAFSDSRRRGARRTVLVGTDCPKLDASRAAAAFDALTRCDLVLGPAWDGGYYLVGLREPIPTLFQDISWGTDTVFERTVRIAERAGMSICVLDSLPDVDRVEDLPHWTKAAGLPILPLHPDRISVVIPARNEAAIIQNTLESLAERPRVEIIVVDGGSTDDTPSIVRRRGVKLLTCRDGRAAQCNLGAAVASGDTLLFLHADTRLPGDFESMVFDALQPADVAAGAFRFRLDDDSPALRMIEWGVNLRSSWFQRPYGDQAIFTRAAAFWAAGGFPDMPILEDYELVRNLRAMGRIEIAPASAVTSARRWNSLGLLRTLWINQKVLLGRRLGVAPRRLADWYRQPTRRAMP